MIKFYTIDPGYFLLLYRYSTFTRPDCRDQINSGTKKPITPAFH